MNKGFTLIELLAVIVILSLLGLITSVSITKVIKDSKDKLSSSQINLIISAAKNWGAENINKLPNKGECKYITLEDLKDNGLIENVVDPKTNKSISDDFKIYIVGNNTSKNKLNINYQTEVSNNTSCTYVNKLCEAVTTATAGNVPKGNFNYGDEYTCDVGDGESKTFFALETKGDNVSLIMDKNIDSNGKGTTSGNTVAWASKEDYIAAGGTEAQYNNNENEKGPLTALKYLKSSTKSWTKIMSSQISLPTISQIEPMANDLAVSGIISYNYKWLFNNLLYDKLFGYWLSEAQGNRGFAHDLCLTDASGDYSQIGSAPAEVADQFGVRPVITLNKKYID